MFRLGLERRVKGSRRTVRAPWFSHTHAGRPVRSTTSAFVLVRSSSKLSSKAHAQSVTGQLCSAADRKVNLYDRWSLPVPGVAYFYRRIHKVANTQDETLSPVYFNGEITLLFISIYLNGKVLRGND